MQEFRKFAVDNISHNPDMKLEYLALDTSVERLVRSTPQKKTPQDKKGKGKETSITKGKTLAQLAQAQNMGWSSTGGVGIGSNALDILNGVGMTGYLAAWDESDDEDLDIGGESGLKIETVENIPFYEVTDVRIFEKDVLLGRL
jgi:hypothetical protein